MSTAFRTFADVTLIKDHEFLCNRFISQTGFYLNDDRIDLLGRIKDHDYSEILGNLLLQVVFHAVIAEEKGLFAFEDVCKTVSEKMIRRHPHVFGDMKLASEDHVSFK